MNNSGIKINHLISFVIFNGLSLLLLLVFASDDFIINLLFLGILLTISITIWNQLVSLPNIALSSYIVFTYLFFYIAPLIQIHSFFASTSRFPNTLPYSSDLVTWALGSVLLFNIIFFTSFKIFSIKDKIIDNNQKNENIEQQKYYFAALVILIASFVAIPLLNMVFGENMELVQDSKASRLILGKVIFFLPFFPALYYMKYRNRNMLILCIISVALLLLFKNPMFEKRNALGPIYLTLLTIYMPSILRSNIKSLLLLFVALVIFFPLISIITHNHDITSEQFFAFTANDYWSMITEVFTSLHYDAFSNIMAAMLYMQEHDIIYGYQLLGSILFFFPRSIWVDKPWGSGMEIGNFLINDYSMWFNNLSMPFVGEGLINFGIIGVILFAMILAYIVKIFGVWMRSDDFTKKITAIYFSYHLIFLLRGDLMNGISYFIGPFIAMYILPRLIVNIKINQH